MTEPESQGHENLQSAALVLLSVALCFAYTVGLGIFVELFIIYNMYLIIELISENNGSMITIEYRDMWLAARWMSV